MNPSAREVLEAERRECRNSTQGEYDPTGNGWWRTSECRYYPDDPCHDHRLVLHGIELAERADLDLVEEWAKRFHEVYEEECHNNGWDSRTPVGWDDLPAANRKTTLATVGRILTELARAAFPEVKESE